ncbi:MAG TPA: CoA transferase [Gemmataceae bacterium]|nr:CoA transferase [Gemmataceae bacterium]
MNPLDGVRVVALAVNLPGPLAAARLRDLGAAVAKVEPPAGDPLFHARPGWYAELTAGQEIRRLDLKQPADRGRLEELLRPADLLLTSARPPALHRLGLSWPELHARHPRLCHVALVGELPPRDDAPGHDLTYQARLGLVDPPHLPRSLLADLAGAEEAVSAALALLLGRERGQEAGHAVVSLAAAAERFARPLREGLTAPGGMLGGGLPGYGLYRASDGWVAVAALEPHFWQRLQAELGLSDASRAELEAAFRRQPARWWEEWAAGRDLPVVAVAAGSTADPAGINPAAREARGEPLA